jgi:hypothetical protein
MKKYSIYLIMILIIIFSVNGCTPDKKENNSSHNIQFKQEMFATFLHGILVPDPEIRELSYNGKEIKVQYNIENGEQEASFGLFIFVNGILQPYYVNGNNTTMYEIKMSKNQNITIPISFEPIQVNKSSGNTVNFLLMLNPSFYPKGESKIFGHNQTISQLVPWNLESNIETQDITSSSIIALENYTFASKEKNNSENNNLLEISINSNSAIVLDENNAIPLSINSKIDGKYRVSVYVNHNLVKAFDGYQYIDINCQNDTAYNLSINIDSNNFSNTNQNDHFVYAIAVPVDYDYNNSDIQVVKSATVILKNN